MNWISCKDQMPERFQEVIFYATHGLHRHDIMTGYNKDSIWYCTYMFYGNVGLINDIQVTHWIPLPDYPK